MKYLIISCVLLLSVLALGGQGYAGVAEASTVSEHHYNTDYDFSGLSAKERDWFLTFLRGNILAEGWSRITDDLLKHVAQDERGQKRQMLNRLGSKIGREWCRDNKVRRIDSSMLSGWGKLLRKAAKHEPQRLAEVIHHIDGEVDSLLD